MAYRQIMLGAPDQERLDRLAELVGRDAEEVLPYVLRDGFDTTEQCARAVLQGRQAVIQGDVVSHVSAIARLDALFADLSALHRGKAT